MNANDLHFAKVVLLWAAKTDRMRWGEYNCLLRAVKRSERRVIGCESKDYFHTFDAAERVATRPREHDKDPMRAYKCMCCAGYHVGSIDVEARRAKERILERLQEKELT